MVHIFWKSGNSKFPHFPQSPLRASIVSLYLLFMTERLITASPHFPKADIARLAFKGWTFKSPQSRPTPPFFPEFTPSRLSQNDQEELYKYGHGLEQDLSHLRDMSGSGSEDSSSTITPGQGTMRCRALSF